MLVLPVLSLGVLGSLAAESASSVFADEREKMLQEQIEARGLRSASVLAAMRKVPRHEFVPLHLRHEAYADFPLPIGGGQTISQPYIVALMTDLARVGPGSRVLEVGTGSGYQAAVLSEIVGTVFSIEIMPELAARAEHCLSRLGYRSIRIRTGDGYQGWPEEAPFDAIIVTAAPPRVPKPLVEQLKIGGRLVIPVGVQLQELKVITRRPDGETEENVIPVRFVPMTGKAQEQR